MHRHLRSSGTNPSIWHPIFLHVFTACNVMTQWLVLFRLLESEIERLLLHLIGKILNFKHMLRLSITYLKVNARVMQETPHTWHIATQTAPWNRQQMFIYVYQKTKQDTEIHHKQHKGNTSTVLERSISDQSDASYRLDECISPSWYMHSPSEIRKHLNLYSLRQTTHQKCMQSIWTLQLQ